MSVTKKPRKAPRADRKGAELREAATMGLPLNQREIAEALCVSTDTISRYMKQGMPHTFAGAVQHQARGCRPRFRYPACVEWMDKRTLNPAAH